MQKAAPRLLIAGTNSGCGKTTVTCAILQALVDGGVPVAAAKCGPDYIDPMFHREIIGAKSSNLDPFFFDDDTLRFLLAQNGAGKDVTVIEGVMGYYDGIGLDSPRASSTAGMRKIRARTSSRKSRAEEAGAARMRAKRSTRAIRISTFTQT